MVTMSSKNVVVTIELGHTATVRNQKPPTGFTHDWTVFVKGVDGAPIETFVEKIVFFLHNSFPKPKRVLKKPPFSVNELGYGGFTLPIEIHFKSNDEPQKASFQYDLFLQSLEQTTISKTRFEKLTFLNPTDEFRRKLVQGGGTEVSSSEDSKMNEKSVSRPSNGAKTKPVVRQQTNTTPTNHSSSGDSKKKLKIVEQPKKAPEPTKSKPKPDSSFQALFGEIIRPKKGSDQKLPKEKSSTKEREKSTSSSKEKSSSSSSKSEPKKDKEKERHTKESSKEKDSRKEHKKSSKERDRSKEKHESKSEKKSHKEPEKSSSKEKEKSHKKSSSHSSRSSPLPPLAPPPPPPQEKKKEEENKKRRIEEPPPPEKRREEPKEKKHKSSSSSRPSKAEKPKEPTPVKAKVPKVIPRSPTPPPPAPIPIPVLIPTPPKEKVAEKSVKRGRPPKEPKRQSPPPIPKEKSPPPKSRSSSRSCSPSLSLSTSSRSSSSSSSRSHSSSSRSSSSSKSKSRSSSRSRSKSPASSSSVDSSPSRGKKPSNEDKPLKILLKAAMQISSSSDEEEEQPPPKKVSQGKVTPSLRASPLQPKVERPSPPSSSSEDSASEEETRGKPIARRSASPFVSSPKMPNGKALPPPPPVKVEPLELNQDYLKDLVKLRRKIHSSSNRAKVQEIVQIIGSDDSYVLSEGHFTFDLCALDKQTIKRLQDCLS